MYNEKQIIKNKETMKQRGLQMFFENKRDIENLFKEDLEIRIEILLGLVPEGVKEYMNEFLLTPEWIQALYENSVKGNFNLDKIRELGDYGFKSNDDAITKLNLLKEAWKEVIEINISDRGYIEVIFKMVLKK